MSKQLKKEPYKVKFDITAGNLDCFMRLSSRHRESESAESHSRKRKKSKMSRDRKQEFEDNAFLENILTKVLNEEFRNPGELKQLIDTMQFPAAEQPVRYLLEEPLLTDGLSIIDLKNKSDTNYRSIIRSCQEQQKDSIGDFNGQYVSGKKDDIDTNQSSTVTPRQSEELDLFTRVMMPHYVSHEYQYYQHDNYYHGSLSRRRRQQAHEEPSEYKIFLDKIQQDGRTTLMIRHIPNKYSEMMLLEELNRNHKMKFNFLYLPIDNYNSCNVGYAFVNFIHTKFIKDFYMEFNGKKWNKFNSEKICELAYARIQGTVSLIDHFQNSGHCSQIKDRRRVQFDETIEPRDKEPKEAMEAGDTRELRETNDTHSQM